MKSKNLIKYRNLKKRGFPTNYNPEVIDIVNEYEKVVDHMWEIYKNNPPCRHWLNIKMSAYK